MKSEELMVGDYLTFPDVQNDSNCPKLRVIAVNEEDVYVSVDGDPVADLCDPKELAGIPLTPEILEKNGFGEQRFERMSVWSILGFSIELDFSTWKYYWANGDVEISSVHELQHCLKLCGINKTIEL